MLQLLGASILNATQTVAAFTFLAVVDNVSYSVANVSKRVVVITLSIVYFGQKATVANVRRSLGVLFPRTLCPATLPHTYTAHRR